MSDVYVKTDGAHHPSEKHFSVVNPSRMCQPMGAVQALMGVKNSITLIHGSQGCSTYMRFQLTRHLREPVEVASTALNEKTVIYGGEYNLMKALKNITEKQKPSIIGVVSSCLTETIGDDMAGIIEKFKEANLGKQLPEIIPISTPSYAGSHIEGYDKAIKGLVEHLSLNSTPNGKINVVPGHMSPADIGEVKDILKTMECDSIILADTSESLDAPLSESVLGLPNCGTTIEEIEDTANSSGTITLSKHADSAGKFLEKKFSIKSVAIPTPIGLRNTDSFINAICDLTDLEIPAQIERDRGRLMDAIVDAHAYNYHRKVAIFGDPDFVVAMASFVAEMGMLPVVLCIGIKSAKFMEDIKTIPEGLSGYEGFSPVILEGADLYDLEKELETTKVDLLIGNSYGAEIAKKEGIPLFRMGFPVFDRMGAQRISSMGYNGSIKTADALTNMILDHYYDEAGYEL
ncbi:nitrogenase component 1 [Methanobacterium paludis]|uniref:Oxidoreductase/nitrogenase component 1 n=1 Tax=Methanobacterium paludis (strain DSM 25820 / JCM 18151 / SWAN1) TaxID=868131 RepID=F6D758_METPW|nr:nitrogenase component 1 [Methanobacterium paludis]AEG19017.1 oxidoreductase/nitrogenase component 1 [Methanobacterium paludis]